MSLNKPLTSKHGQSMRAGYLLAFLVLVLMLGLGACGQETTSQTDIDAATNHSIAEDLSADELSTGKATASTTPASAENSSPGGVKEDEQGSAENQELAEIKTLYQRACIACHAYGAAGAPKSHDVAAWATRMSKGREQLMQNMINGIGGMPPRGMCADCSDEELWRITEFMASAQ